jgi:hypothetical protein
MPRLLTLGDKARAVRGQRAREAEGAMAREGAIVLFTHIRRSGGTSLEDQARLAWLSCTFVLLLFSL